MRFRRSSMYQALGLNEDFHANEDRFTSFEGVSAAIKATGLESCNLILGVDFTASNEWQGRKCFRGKSLHHLSRHAKKLNPYQRVIQIIAKTLEPFDELQLIRAFGFGDSKCKDHSVFSFTDDDSPCKGIRDVLDKYSAVLSRVSLSGPTSFAPIVRKAIEVIEQEKNYSILVIIADGQVTNEQDEQTVEAIVAASHYPLSIIVVGVGDGPWDQMHEYDVKLPARLFDNFQFIEFNEVVQDAKFPDATFALHALMEIPDQYNSIQKLGLLSSTSL